MKNIPNNTDTVVLDGKTIDYEFLRNVLGMPHNAIVNGCHSEAIGADDEIQLQKVYHFSRCLPFDGFSEKMFAKLAKDSDILYDPFLVFNPNIVDESFLEDQGFGPGQTKKFIKARNKFLDGGIELRKLIQAYGILNCGESISTEYAKEWAGLEPDYSGKTKAVIDEVRENHETLELIKEQLTTLGYKVNDPINLKTYQSDALVILTGSPKTFGYSTKSEFLGKVGNLLETKKWGEATILITDDLSSKSSKMVKATKQGLEIMTYEQVADKFSN